MTTILRLNLHQEGFENLKRGSTRVYMKIEGLAIRKNTFSFLKILTVYSLQFF